MSLPKIFKDSKRMWILGSSLIKHFFVHVKKIPFWKYLQLQLHNVSLLWQGIGNEITSVNPQGNDAFEM